MHTKTLFRLALVALLLVAGGCAVISEQECHAGLWYERGVQDGASGRTQATVYDIAQKCQEYGVRADSEAWMRGHEEGVEQFCTPENGFMHGRRGRDYSGVCTGPTADLFLAEYQRGLQIYQYEQQYYAFQKQHDGIAEELQGVSIALSEAESKDEIRALKVRRSGLRRELRSVERDMRIFEQQMFMRGFSPTFFPGFLYY